MIQLKLNTIDSLGDDVVFSWNVGLQEKLSRGSSRTSSKFQHEMQRNNNVGCKNILKSTVLQSEKKKENIVPRADEKG